MGDSVQRKLLSSIMPSGRVARSHCRLTFSIKGRQRARGTNVFTSSRVEPVSKVRRFCTRLGVQIRTREPRCELLVEYSSASEERVCHHGNAE